MKLFRNQFTTRIFSLITAVVFLNMGFFLAEMCLMDFQDQQVIENVSKLILNGGLEEERDTHSGGDTPLKLFSQMSSDALLHHSNLFLIAVKIHQTLEDLYPHANHSIKFSQPPDAITTVS